MGEDLRVCAERFYEIKTIRFQEELFMKKAMKTIMSVVVVFVLAAGCLMQNAFADVTPSKPSKKPMSISYSITGIYGNYIVHDTDYVGYGCANTTYTVTAAQDGLTRVDYYYSSINCNPGGVDGSFGGGTYNAIRNFQFYTGLSVDGTVGPDTWAELSAMTNNQ